MVPFLYHADVHIRGDLLDVFFEISKGFEEPIFSYLTARGEGSLRSAEEVGKNYGIAAHINLNSEDKIDKNRFLACANQY